MPDLSSLKADDVLAASQIGSVEASACFARAFDVKLSVVAGEPGKLTADTRTGELEGPGLVLLFCRDDAAAIALLPAASDLLPAWCAAPDNDGSVKLQMLAKELSSVLLPDGFEPTEVATAYVESLNDALGRASFPDEAALVPFILTREDGVSGMLRLVWPVTRVETVYGALGMERRPSPVSEVTLVADRGDDDVVQAPTRRCDSALAPSAVTSVDDLPPYARSLLRIEVPVMVNLATKRQAVGRILELGVGAIIQFDKSCDELLDLYVGNQRIAQGEAVKVGEKFGIRITSIALPEERFEPVRIK